MQASICTEYKYSVFSLPWRIKYPDEQQNRPLSGSSRRCVSTFIVKNLTKKSTFGVKYYTLKFRDSRIFYATTEAGCRSLNASRGFKFNI